MGVFYRRLPKFEYLQPGSLEEILLFLSVNKEKVRVLAGGTDLIVQLRRREIAIPDYVADIKRISQLKRVVIDEEGIRIGALVPISEIAAFADIKRDYKAMSDAANTVASPQIRNRATVAGNICNAVPSADTAPPLLVFGAAVKLKSEKAERSVPIDEFFTGPRKTAIAPDEIVTGVFIPKPAAGSKSIYYKHSQRHSMDLALVGVAAYGHKDAGVCKEVRIGLGAVAPKPVRAVAAEKILLGQKPSLELIEAAAAAAATECSPIDDHRASSEYRRDMVQIFTKRALTEILL